MKTLNMYINASPLVYDSMSSRSVPLSLVSPCLDSAIKARLLFALGRQWICHAGGLVLVLTTS